MQNDHLDPNDPPRRRANKRRGLGTMENDRPPILGVVGRTTGQIRLNVCDNTQQTTIQPQVERETEPTTNLYTDESGASFHLYSDMSGSNWNSALAEVRNPGVRFAVLANQLSSYGVGWYISGERNRRMRQGKQATKSDAPFTLALDKPLKVLTP